MLSSGQWKAQPPLCTVTLDDRLKQLHGHNRDEFLDFMMCMLRWLLESRLTARQLLEQPRLQGIE